MVLDLQSRRSIRKISRADFAVFPVWEWAINEEETAGLDESFLRPTMLTSIAPGLSAHYVVGASATLSDGSVLPACAEVTVAGKKLGVEPLYLFVQERQLDVGTAETMTVLSHLTGQAEARAVSWTLAVPLDGQSEPPSGKISRPLGVRLASLFKRSPSGAAAKAVKTV